MAYSLLAHLYTHIRGSQEDIATLALQYLLMQSAALNKVFTKRIASILNVEVEELLQYSTQVIGEDNERPDMAGIDSNGKEQILCEMKFYAGLTTNQPLGYLKRLEENGGKGLVFICPKSRIDSLWFELKKICKEADKAVKVIDDCSVSVDGINMAIITWAQVIEALTDTAQASAEYLLADIKQLKGYCEQIDSDAFIPFKPEELTAENAKKADRFYMVVDKVTKLLLCDESIKANKNGLKFSPNSDGCISYIYVNDYALAICYDRGFWGNSKTKDTPFWLFVKRVVEGKQWKQTEDIVNQLKKYPESMKVEYDSVIYLALNVLTYATEDEVCKDIKNQILKYIKEIDKGIHEEGRF